MQTCERAIDISAIQKELKAEGVAGWLFYSFHGSDPIAARVLGLPEGHLLSRRWFYYIPGDGQPVKLVHRIEMEALDMLPGSKLVYLGWKELSMRLQELLPKSGKVAMQYSPDNAVPYVSRVDAGTIELVRRTGVEVVSSANLIQTFEAKLTPWDPLESTCRHASLSIL